MSTEDRSEMRPYELPMAKYALLQDVLLHCGAYAHAAMTTYLCDRRDAAEKELILPNGEEPDEGVKDIIRLLAERRGVKLSI